MAVKQTAGRDALGEFAPKFAELNDDVLFGQVWSREDKISLRDRSIVTIVALMAQGLTDSSFQYHLTAAKNNGVTKTEIAEMPILQYSSEIRSAVLLVHGEKAHSRYFSETAYSKLTGDNKELLIIPGASHTDLYDQMDVIPFEKLKAFFTEYLR